MSLLTHFSSTFIDVVVFLTNLYSFHRLDAMQGIFHGNAPPDTLMNLYLVHLILSRLVTEVFDGEGPSPTGLGSRYNGTQPGNLPNQYNLNFYPWEFIP